MKQFDIPSSKLLLLIFLITVSISAIDITRIPLTYAFGSDMITKLPIEISFNHSNVYSTSLTNHLFLLKYNLSVAVESFPRKPESNKIEIGLKYPSNFISAMAASFKVSYDSVQFGKSQYLEVILFDDNYVQNRDYFYNEDSYKVHVKYNFGDDMMIDDKPCKLIDGSIIYFQEYLIRQALNKMTKQNLINFKFHQDNHTVQLFGKLQNLPKLTLVRGDFIFKMKIQGDIIHYLPAIDNIDRHTLIGYKALYQFNKFKFDQNNNVIFKRTSLVYQLYLFLIYFTILCLFLIYISRKNIYDTSQFIKHVLKWVLLMDRVSRIQVMKSQLE